MKKEKKFLEHPGLIYGPHVILSLLRDEPKKISVIYITSRKIDALLEEIIALAKESGVPLQGVAKTEMHLLIADVNTQGVVAKLHDTKVSSHDEKDLPFLLERRKDSPFILLLDGVQDPHNLGACLRTAHAAGVHMVIAPKDRACALTPVVRKVASGAADLIPFIQVTNLVRTMNMLKERNIWLYGADQNAEICVFDAKLCGGVGFVLGGEGKGLRRLTREACDFLVAIPMLGSISSLNVSVATGVCLFERVRQNRINR